jgi:hypothetical protein
MGICQHARAKLEKRSKLDSIPGFTASEYFSQDTSDKAKYIQAKKNIVKVKTTSEIKQSEDKVKAECIAWLKLQRYVSRTVYLGGIPVGMGKLAPNPIKGFPDTIVMNPFAKSGKKFLLVEYKKSHGGILSQEQLNWHAELKACEIKVFACNSLNSLIEQFNEWVKQ